MAGDLEGFEERGIRLSESVQGAVERFDIEIVSELLSDGPVVNISESVVAKGKRDARFL